MNDSHTLIPGRNSSTCSSFVPGIVIDVRYATSNNFMHQKLYPLPVVFLRRSPAEALRDVQTELATRGLGLKVFDGYRPYRVTERMWEPIAIRTLSRILRRGRDTIAGPPSI